MQFSVAGKRKAETKDKASSKIDKRRDEREEGSCYDAVGHLSLSISRLSLPEPMQFIRPFLGLPRVTFKTYTSTLDIVVGAVIACGQLLANNSNYRGVERGVEGGLRWVDV